MGRTATSGHGAKKNAMTTAMDGKPVEILLVEDNPGDVRLTQEALKEGKVRNNLQVARDGVEALEMPRSPANDRPDVILLDLNLPRKDGREVLAEIKADENLKHIPVIVLTTSRDEHDVLGSYRLASCYITKPVDLDQFLAAINAIRGFWLTVVRLPA